MAAVLGPRMAGPDGMGPLMAHAPPRAGSTLGNRGGQRQPAHATALADASGRDAWPPC